MFSENSQFLSRNVRISDRSKIICKDQELKQSESKTSPQKTKTENNERILRVEMIQ